MEFLGCFKDVAERILPTALDPDLDNTPARCGERCRQRGYTYAGVVNGTECHCGRLQPFDSLKLATNDDCDTPCPGDALKMCGGSTKSSDITALRISVYYVEPDGNGCNQVNH